MIQSIKPLSQPSIHPSSFFEQSVNCMVLNWKKDRKPTPATKRTKNSQKGYRIRPKIKTTTKNGRQQTENLEIEKKENDDGAFQHRCYRNIQATRRFSDKLIRSAVK